MNTPRCPPFLPFGWAPLSSPVFVCRQWVRHAAHLYSTRLQHYQRLSTAVTRWVCAGTPSAHPGSKHLTTYPPYSLPVAGGKYQQHASRYHRTKSRTSQCDDDYGETCSRRGRSRARPLQKPTNERSTGGRRARDEARSWCRLREGCDTISGRRPSDATCHWRATAVPGREIGAPARCHDPCKR